MYLFAGTYERFLFGFNLPEAEAKGGQNVGKKYTYAAHQHPVKCVAAGGYFLASGGADDQIHLYDMKHGKDLGYLMNPGDGAVPCLQFYCPPGAGGAPSHMFSGSADGSIAVWRAGAGWEHLKLMKGHKSSVNSITIHQSGRLAFSVSHDHTLRMWDLAKGNSNYTVKLDAEGDQVAFTPDGDSYLLVSGPKATVHSVVGEGEVVARLDAPRRITALTQLDEHSVLAGLEDGSIKVWDLRANSIQQSVERAHGTRIRGLVHYHHAGVFGAASTHVASASSDGVIKVWDIRTFTSSSNQPVTCLAETATQARITCLTTVNSRAPGPKPPAAAAPKAAAGKQTAAHAGMQAGAARGRVQPGKGTKDSMTVADKKQGGKQQTGSRKPEISLKQGGRREGTQKKGVKPAAQQSPGFEIVSEQQLAARQEKKRKQQLPHSDDDSGDDMPGALDARKAARATVRVKVKQAKPIKSAAGSSGQKTKSKMTKKSRMSA